MQEGQRRILCAESNDDIGDLIVLMLEQKGYAVEAVRTAADCLRLAGAEQFDLYVLDDREVDGDSLELCRELRSLDPRTPVLLFTLDRVGLGRRRAAAAGAEFHAGENSDFAALVTTIEQMLRPH